jgi:fructose-bisphosphate aldolase class I
MAGEHTFTLCGEVTEDVLREVFSQLHTQGVLLEGVLLKTNMVPQRYVLSQPFTQPVEALGHISPG